MQQWFHGRELSRPRRLAQCLLQGNLVRLELFLGMAEQDVSRSGQPDLEYTSYLHTLCSTKLNHVRNLPTNTDRPHETLGDHV
jgi:hypothetical protein